jgi:hypothetical protein
MTTTARTLAAERQGSRSHAERGNEAVPTHIQIPHLGLALAPRHDYLLPQHFLYFLPLPQGHVSLRPAAARAGGGSPRRSDSPSSAN